MDTSRAKSSIIIFTYFVYSTGIRSLNNRRNMLLSYRNQCNTIHDLRNETIRAASTAPSLLVLLKLVWY